MSKISFFFSLLRPFYRKTLILKILVFPNMSFHFLSLAFIEVSQLKHIGKFISRAFFGFSFLSVPWNVLKGIWLLNIYFLPANCLGMLWLTLLWFPGLGCISPFPLKCIYLCRICLQLLDLSWYYWQCSTSWFSHQQSATSFS